MVLTIQEEVAENRKYYDEVIKPLIEKGMYEIAAFELSNTLFSLKTKRMDLVCRVPCGLSYLISGEMLEEKLKTAKSKKDLGDTVKRFEAYQAQTKLPLTK
jgi:hypothetical protein